MKNLILLITTLICTIPVYSQSITDCSDCNSILLTQRHINEKSLEELALLRNEIYARNGYVFSNHTYAVYFNKQNWYERSMDNNSIKLSTVETKNVEFLKKAELKEATKRKNALNNLEELKKALNSNNTTTVNRYLSKIKETERESTWFLEELKITLNYINLQNIHWNKNSGIYKITIDNGHHISYYKIEFTYDKVMIESSEINQNSEIFGDFDDGYSDYASETEGTVFYEFKLEDKGIIFEAVHVAG